MYASENVVCCQVERSPTECGVPECDLITAIKKRSRSTRCFGTIGKTNVYVFEGCELLLPKTESLVICYRGNGWFFHSCLERVDFEFTFKH